MVSTFSSHAAAFLEAVADRLSPSTAAAAQMEGIHFRVLQRRHHGGAKGRKFAATAMETRPNHGFTPREGWHRQGFIQDSRRSGETSNCKVVRPAGTKEEDPQRTKGLLTHVKRVHVKFTHVSRATPPCVIYLYYNLFIA